MAQTIITLSRELAAQERQVYMFLDLLGDLGGLTEIFMVTFGFFIIPIAEHSYSTQAVKRLFLAKTDDENLFLKPDLQKEGGVRPNKYLGATPYGKDHLSHRHIRISFLDDCLLFLANLLRGSFESCGCDLSTIFCCCWSKKDKLQ